MSGVDGVAGTLRFQYRRLLFWALVVATVLAVAAVFQYDLHDPVLALAESPPDLGPGPWCDC